MKQIKVAHVITRMILGGAQENTLLSVEGLQANPMYSVDLVTGPALGPEGTLLDRAAAHKVRVVLVKRLRRAINLFNDLCAFFVLLRLFKKGNYDVVHTHSSKAGVLGRFAARMAKVPVVVHTIHGLPFHEHAHPIMNVVYIFLEKWMARYTHSIVTVCPEMSRKALEKHIGTPEQYTVVYSGIEVERYAGERGDAERALRERFGIPQNAVVVGKIARLFELKGHEYLLPAIGKVLESFPDTYFLLVGDGLLRKKLEKEAQRLGIAERLIFAGLVPTVEVPTYIRVMDIVVHLSMREGLPRVVPQAFLCKKPVIAYDVDGAKDILRHNYNGFLLYPKTIDGLVEKINMLVKNEKLRVTMGTNGYNDALALFPTEKMVADLDALYQRMLVCGR